MKVIINEQHTLLKEQRDIIEKNFFEWDTLLVPACGWTLKEMKDVFEKLKEEEVVFVSPVPYLIRELALNGNKVHIFHNDHREKKELPGGKIIQIISQTGWQLI